MLNRSDLRLLGALICALIPATPSCSNTEGTNSADAGLQDTGGNGGSAGNASNGGNDSGGTGGSSAAAGTTPNAGAGGNQAGSSGSGGASNDSGAGGESNGGVGGDGGGPSASTGCSKANPATGTLEMTIEGNAASYIVSLPSNYDENHPYSLGFAFHGRDRTGPNCHDGDCIGFQSVMGDKAILVYMTSLGGTGWEGDGERDLNIAFFTQVLARLKNDYCVDQRRIFVAGTSSGANFTNILACRFGDQLLAAAPVAGAMLEKENCAGPVAALLIHGVDDYHVPFASGEDARVFYATQNGCSHATVPAILDIHDSVVATRESHQCAEYQDCHEGLPVVWCEHSEGGYDGSTHGWPTFGGQQIWDFVSALP